MDDGKVFIGHLISPAQKKRKQSSKMSKIVKSKTFYRKVTRIMNFGHLSICPKGKRFDPYFQNSVTNGGKSGDAVKIGDIVEVKVIEIDNRQNRSFA
jgi:polyribonucleotide nucleotidyltransferase